MNRSQRMELDSIIERIEELIKRMSKGEPSEQFEGETECIADDLERMADEEEAKVDCMPENLQWSQRADAMRDAVDALRDAQYEVQDCTEQSLRKAIQYIHNAQA